MAEAVGSRIADWLRGHATHRPNAPCIVDGGAGPLTLSFAEVYERVNRLANGLAGLGARPGDRIGLLGADNHEYLETLLASIALGTTFVPLNTRLVTREIVGHLTAAKATILVADARNAEKAIEARAAVPTLRTVVGLGDGWAGQSGVETTVAELIAGGADRPPSVTVADEQILGLAFTSGTTAGAKGVLQSHRMLKALAIQTLVDRRLVPETFQYAAAPLFHISGLAYSLTGIALGFPSLLLPEFHPATVLRWLDEGGVTDTFFVPTMISSLLQEPGVADRSYPALRVMGYGAAPMPPALLRRAMDVFDCEFIQMFGAGTEAGTQTVLGAAEHRRALAGESHLLGSIGKPAFNVELRLCDSDLNDVPRGQVGEIVTRGDVIMSGYLNAPEATAAAMLPGGWFRGGDLAWQDEEGYLYLAGRKRDMIIRGGENIYPIEIEAVLHEHPDVLEAAVVGTPDEHWGEVVTAFVVPVAGRTIDAEALRDFCAARLARYKVPSRIETREELPKNASGKILKRALVD